MFENVRVAFEPISEDFRKIFGKWSEIFGKSPQTPLCGIIAFVERSPKAELNRVSLDGGPWSNSAAPT